MKIILNNNFQIESIDDEKASRVVKGSNLFDELGVYVPQALYNRYTSIYPSYSVRRADNRQLGDYAMSTADNTFTGYYGWKTHLHQRDIAVAGPLEITISFALDGTVKKTICKVTINVDSAIELSNDVFIVTRGENDEILAIESLVDAVEDLQQECTNVSNALLLKADLNNANQEITAKKVEAETLKQDNNNVLDSSDVVDNVTTEDATKVLSAKQGKVLKALIDALTTSLSTEYYKKAQTYSSTEIDGLIANFVTKSVNDLTNYYLKTETYNKTEIDNMLSTLSSFEVVQSLPTENIKTSVIYLLQNGTFYDEYIYSNNDWVMIGTTNIDFSDYYTKAQINAMLNVINEAINGVDIVNEEVEFEADVPSSAKGMATLSKVGGMSYKSENLLYDLGTTITNNGLTFTISNGVIAIQGTPTADYAGVSVSLNNFSLNGTYTFKNFSSNTNVCFIRITFVKNGSRVYSFYLGGTTKTNSYTFDGTETLFKLEYAYQGTEHPTINETFTPMLNKGSTALPYQPYFEGIRDSAVTSLVSKDSNDTAIATHPIASEIQALDGYGWGVNDTCYNYIDYEAKKFIQNVARVDLGSLTYTKYEVTEGNLYRANLPSNSIYNTQNCLCALFTVTNRLNRANKEFYINNDSGGASSNIGTFVDIIDNSYLTSIDFKTAMTGVYLYYELATPIETDISSYLGDKHIPIEANGSLTFTNTYNQAVPSTIIYDCGLIEVVKTNHEHDLEQQKDIDTLKANQKQLQTDVSGLDTRLDDVEGDVSILKTDVNTLKGVHLYQHTIIAESSQTNKQCKICFTILNSSATPITAAIDVWIYLYNNNNPIKLQASGVMFYSNSYETVSYIYSDLDIYDDSRYIYVVGKNQLGELFDYGATITDSVKQLF